VSGYACRWLSVATWCWSGGVDGCGYFDVLARAHWSTPDQNLSGFPDAIRWVSRCRLHCVDGFFAEISFLSHSDSSHLLLSNLPFIAFTRLNRIASFSPLTNDVLLGRSMFHDSYFTHHLHRPSHSLTSMLLFNI